jgi:hypothetical protein
MAQHHGEPDFDMQAYLALQTAFRSSFLQLSKTGKHSENGKSILTGGFDLREALNG